MFFFPYSIKKFFIRLEFYFLLSGEVFLFFFHSLFHSFFFSFFFSFFIYIFYYFVHYYLFKILNKVFFLLCSWSSKFEHRVLTFFFVFAKNNSIIHFFCWWKLAFELIFFYEFFFNFYFCFWKTIWKNSVKFFYLLFIAFFWTFSIFSFSLQLFFLTLCSQI